MKLVEDVVLARYEPNRVPLCAGLTYIHPLNSILLRRLGFEVSNDVHDDFSDSISEDNGKTWSEPTPAASSTLVEGGFIAHTENAFLYLPERNLLFHFTNDKFEPDLGGGANLDSNSKVRITWGKPVDVSQHRDVHSVVSDFGLKQGIYISFCQPLHDARGRILVPVQWQSDDRAGDIRGRGFPARGDLPAVMQDVWRAGVLIGELNENSRDENDWQWRLAGSVPYDFDRTSRGLYEGTLAELGDGSLAFVLRGSNAAWPEKPGHKWLSFSRDGGESWTMAVPLGFDDGAVFQSSSSGSILFRSWKDNTLYWVGNLCDEGQEARGNFPRSPLIIAEVQEEPFALKRASLFDVGRCAPGAEDYVQYSNFKVLQERETGDVLIFLSLYGEFGGEGPNRERGDLHQFRVNLYGDASAQL